MTQPLRLGIAGLGTVGAGLISIIQQQGQLLAQRAGREVVISAVSARSKGKDRGVNISDYAWEDDPVVLAARDDIDVFVELMGGEDGPAKAATEAAIAKGKHVVTANKAMLAIHGQALAEIAEAAGVQLNYEAAVAGGIPCIKALREGLAGNAVSRVIGVMNGTCNYILTRMEDAGLSYAEAFAEADGLGYLEADPTLDVGGIDAAHKLVLLGAIAFGSKVDFASASLQGIDVITAEDISAARELGFRIKLLGLAEIVDGALVQTMQPSLVPLQSPLAGLEGGTNMIIFEGDAVGQIVMRGAGAGAGPTASAVLGDIMDVARGFSLPVFGVPAHELTEIPAASSQSNAAYYLRLNLQDEAGAMAKVTTILADCNISIDRMRQKSHADDSAPVIIITHPTSGALIQKALHKIEGSGICQPAPISLRIAEV